MNTIVQNKTRAILIYALRTAALLCANGSLMQTFLSVTGFSEQHIYIHASLFQAVNVLTILLCARFADRGNAIRRSAVVQIPGALLFLFYLPLCLLQNVSASAYVWLLLICILQSVTIALHTICEYKIPYYIFRVEEYGMVMSVCGILSSAVSFGCGALISFFCTRFAYNRIMLIAFGLSCLFMLAAAGLQMFQKSLLPPEDLPDTQKKPEKIPLMTMFRHEAFSHLLVGNLTRGIANGTTTVLAAAALSIGYDETLTSAMVSVSSLANLAACALFAIAARWIHPRFVILGGSLCFLTLPLLLLRDRPVLYLILYAVLLFGRTLVDYAVPSALLYAVPVEIAGTYNAWRMILHNGGTMLATLLAGFLPLPVILVISMVFQLISGVNFCTARVMRKSAAASASAGS
ncbi:MAG: MFS transporter [Clostridia bacterium]|nr:MFS transporter [Clostridia bacterium]